MAQKAQKTAKRTSRKAARKAAPAKSVRAAAGAVVRGAVRRRKQPGRVFVVAGPSGVGKTTLCRKALEKLPGRLHWSISHTTRPQREGEVDGRDYHFIKPGKFAQMIERGEFVEHAVVHDNYYGTSKKELRRIQKSGGDALVEIDVQGALQIKNEFPEAVMIFILPPTLKALDQRLRGRGTDSARVIRRRLENAYGEIAEAPAFHYQIVNEDIDHALADLVGIVHAEACRV